MSGALEFIHVARSFRTGPVLRDVSFSVGEGEVVGLLGRNGCGKTTLIKIAMGMLHPDSGEAQVFGLSPVKDPVAVRKRVGYVAEDQNLPDWARVGDLIAFYRYLFPRWDRAMERDLLDRFALPLEPKLSELSKGQSRQVALVCAVCHRPDLLLLDEPAGGLDPVARREFLETSIQLLNREGTSILFSSHQTMDVERLGARVVFLGDGEIQLDRNLDDLHENVCLAIVPRASSPDAGRIRSTPGCLRVRPVYEDWHAVMEGAPGAVAERLVGALGHNGIRCVRLPLEELFIELAGSRR